MLESLFLAGMIIAFQVPFSGEITPEFACGADYHQFSPPAPVSPHSPHTATLDSILSSEVVVEGKVTAKRTYLGSGVQNDVSLRILKALKGSGVAAGDVITVHVQGGYAADDEDGHECLRDDLSDGMRVEVGRTYLVSLTKEGDTPDYRADDLAGWFRIANNGDIIPLTPALVRNRALAGKKITEVETRAKEAR